MQWAIADDYAVFTHDLDFATMLALSGADGPSVLQVRCLNVLPESIGTLVLSLLKTYGPEIEQGAPVVADERRERVRILPLNRQNRGIPGHLCRALGQPLQPGRQPITPVLQRQHRQQQQRQRDADGLNQLAQHRFCQQPSAPYSCGRKLRLTTQPAFATTGASTEAEWRWVPPHDDEKASAVAEAR